ncbi:histidine kinase/DNA gyrase B/HSP90-like ATPase [Ruminococcaceae bacterium R-25]|nr:histidine kinase/DNA gyrase B/HSP90-like ATPase [Ruminococcaceae bacterium R-25]SUQ21838.1 His Kinase A (phospho-acceptor) domain-containing protein [Oscillospiraceae bacterium]
MITGKTKSKTKRKTSIVEPKFGKIFWVRFLIMLAVFSLVAVYAWKKLDDHVEEMVNVELYTLIDDIELSIKDLYNTDPDSDEYQEKLADLKIWMAVFQNLNYTYAEVTVGDLKLTTEDASFYSSTRKDDSGRSVSDTYFIEDMSYYEPLTSYKDGLFDPRVEWELYNSWARDPLFREMGLSHVGKYDFFESTELLTAYINREKHTFIPGIIRVTYMDETYEIDCTPADTKGYEKAVFSDDWEPGEVSRWFGISYKNAPELSSKNITAVCFCDPDGITSCLDRSEFEEKVNSGELKNLTWTIGYYIPEYKHPDSVLRYAPFSCALIVIASLLSALAAALVWSIVKYQKEKTVWEIFEYRTKTTEAMAHDLKTPLAAIMAYAENLEASSEDPSKVREYSKNINEKVSTMDHMIGDILSFSRSETGKIDIVKEELSIAEIINESLSALPEMKADLKGDAKIETDRKLLKQAIDNLLSNCDRYGDKESPVDITVDSENILIINKTDKTYDDADSLKKPFVKGEDSRGGKGTGLGLAIADNNLNILGYKLELISEKGIFKAIVKFKI